ncbi:polynucleotide kinase 3'-phosphatase [Cladophialophora carrionii CBS 160.54]|uniref:Polynucleotide kinase 3'-phosphatase n=1 Tax=Cladophialophora carrionii CBS 160.54 TaxID=1279043 RepID=V9D676_9EURO|nr:polynucleotide kinase 3'-phosphatase [Cladophialophora carrionii CBS 160.54]ETI22171.1 polynucleotide kinase 3'-phosphatase [Cladophialophora carrionii CBS 160.54]
MKRSAPPAGSISPPLVKRKIESTTTNRAVASFFKPASQKEPEKIVWRTVENSLVIGRYDASNPSPQQRTLPVKIAAFDLDDTLIVPNQGKTWHRSATSWKWWDASVPGRLKSLHDEGYLVVILSNQSTVSLKDNKKLLQKDMASLTNFKSQLSAVLHQLDLPISVYAATGQDKYRKPRIGMWEAVLGDYDLRAEGAVDMTKSFYIGDAAGREKTDKRRKDHATSDSRDLAANIGIKFQTPDEYFLNAPPEPYDHVFEPSRYLQSIQAAEPTTNGAAGAAVSAPFTKDSKQDMVIFCGSPGAGKSTFFWDVLQPLGYERVNQDILKTRDKCIKRARELLESGASVAIDNTNANIETRSHWVKLAREFNVPIRCVRFTASTRLAEHNDAARALNPDIMNPENRSQLPGIAFRSFLQRLQEPTLDEGFQDIYKVDFEFKGTDEQRKLWSRYWVSKYST